MSLQEENENELLSKAVNLINFIETDDTISDERRTTHK